MKTRETLEFELYKLMDMRAGAKDGSPEFAAAIEAIDEWTVINGQDLDATKHEEAA